MYASKLTALYIAVLLMAFLAPAVQARDVATEQYNVTAAQNAFDDTKSDYDATTQQLKDQEKRVTEAHAMLKALQKKQAAAKLNLAKAKLKLDKENKALSRAWNENGQ